MFVSAKSRIAALLSKDITNDLSAEGNNSITWLKFSSANAFFPNEPIDTLLDCLANSFSFVVRRITSSLDGIMLLPFSSATAKISNLRGVKPVDSKEFLIRCS